MLAPEVAPADRLAALDTLIARYDPDRIDLLDRRARIRLEGTDRAWDAVLEADRAQLEEPRGTADATIAADDAAWRQIAEDVRGGMAAFGRRRLRIRRNLHLGIGFLAATAATEGPGALRFESHRSPMGRISMVTAGVGEPVVCVHGLGGTKASFIGTVAALASENRRVIAVDLPGFGDSDKPLSGRYDAAWFADAIVGLLDEMGLDRVDLIGNSMGGRVAIELGLRAPDRVRRMALLSPAMAWLRHDRALAWLLQFPLPRLGLIQPTPRALVEPVVRRLIAGSNDGWAAAGVDEFLRAYLTPSGRYAFYESARNIFRDEPHGDDGFWRRLEAMSPQTLFVWGRQDTLVPVSFRRHVERALPSAEHLVLPGGHVPQVEAPAETHAAIERFFDA